MYYLQIVDADSKTKIVEQRFQDEKAVTSFISKCQSDDFSYSLINEDSRYISCEYVNHVIMTCGEDTFYRIYFKTELDNVYA